MRYDKDFIKESLEIEQIILVLDEFGGNPITTGEDLMADTICHHLPGEGSKKLYYYSNTRLFKCYTGCFEAFDIFQLVVKVFQIQYEQEIELPTAVAFIANKLGFSATFDDEDFSSGKLEDWTIFRKVENLRSVIEKKDREVNLKIYDEAILSVLARPLIKPWLDEGINRETLKQYDISYYPKDCQIIIPHRDMDNNLIGIRGRSLVKSEAELYGKYRPAILNNVMYNHPLGFALYGLNFNKENIKLVKKAIVFEGEKSVMLYNSYFGAENNISVACCGSSISKYQVELLLSLGVQEMVIAFDRQFKDKNDDDFKGLIKNLKNIGDKYKNYLTVSCLFDKENLLGHKSSPIDHGKDTFLALFQNRIIL